MKFSYRRMFYSPICSQFVTQFNSLPFVFAIFGDQAVQMARKSINSGFEVFGMKTTLTKAVGLAVCYMLFLQARNDRMFLVGMVGGIILLFSALPGFTAMDEDDSREALRSLWSEKGDLNPSSPKCPSNRSPFRKETSTFPCAIPVVLVPKNMLRNQGSAWSTGKWMQLHKQMPIPYQPSRKYWNRWQELWCSLPWTSKVATGKSKSKWIKIAEEKLPSSVP